jgi:enhancer of mRNA-decapping protein 3
VGRDKADCNGEVAQNEVGLTEEMMTENAGRGVAESILTALAEPANTIRMQPAGSSTAEVGSAVVVVLAGNSKNGARAIAAARHVLHKGTAVVLCVVGIERGDQELLEGMRQQLRLFRGFGGPVFSKAQLFEHMRKMNLPTLTVNTPRSAINAKPPAVALIVDALLGLTLSFDELRTGDQAAVYELMEWANRNEAFVLSVDVPTGIDPSVGKANVVDDVPLYIRPRYVAAIACPKRGLLDAIHASKESRNATPPTAVDDSAASWKLFLVDICLGSAVWKKAGTKTRRGVDFEGKWLLEFEYHCSGRGRDSEDGLTLV